MRGALASHAFPLFAFDLLDALRMLMRGMLSGVACEDRRNPTLGVFLY
ncbi:hypothetical protein BN2476_330028 [Paraburkholderia piptadeniae]|uniref:Uncharacterized protein n=1 Tax=Paraburkholderia piptadeniae TaxID=1701573 RepID=A0A1N7S668_9BURK|nr:hypothetical protein BN2476_330028 [Paraburkholderia piptadeniae]